MASAAVAAPLRITVALPSPNFGARAALATADAAGLFAKAGLEPEFKMLENGSIAIAALIAGSVEFAVSGPTEVIGARARGQDLVFVANLYRGLSGSLVLSKSAAARTGVTAASSIQDRVHALDGLLIAVPSATSSLLTPIKSAAAAAHAKVRFTYMAQSGMSAALSAGSIDGMVASSPVWMAPIDNGAGVLWIDGPKGELPADLLPVISGALATSGAFARQHPDVIGRVQGVLVSLAEFVRSDPERAKAAFMSAYPKLSPQVAARSFDGESANFTRSELTAADIRHEIDGMSASPGAVPVGSMDAKSLLYRN